METARRRIIIDTDPGIDDSLAILLALASPELQVEGLTVVHGNCSVRQGVRNTLSILELAGRRDIPVYGGCEIPLLQPSLLAPETHGDNGLGYASLPEPTLSAAPGHAVDYLIETILASPGEITLAAVGPLTNLALAIRREPRIALALKEVVCMGGAIRHQGNTTPLAEFNVFVDPHAAYIVYHAGIPVRLVPLDVTYQCILTRANVERLLRTGSPVAQFIADATRFYMEFHDAYQKIEGCIINDPLALALTFSPQLCDYETHFIDVDISAGPGLGKTFADFYQMLNRPANMQVALGVQPGRFIELFIQRIERFIQSKERNEEGLKQ
jgi:purine nucleosidase